MANKVSFFPKGVYQWVRLIIGLIGVTIAVLKYAHVISLEEMATVATLVGFFGYVFDGLNKNVEERKRQTNFKCD